MQNIKVANVHKIECDQFQMCKNWNVLNFECTKMCSLKSFTYVPQCEAQEEELIKSFILNTNHKLNTIPPHTQRARLGAIGTHVSEMKKSYTYVPQCGAQEEEGVCDKRATDSRLRQEIASFFFHPGVQPKQGVLLHTYVYIQILLSSTNLRSCLEKKGEKTYSYMGTQFQAGPYLDLQHICLLTNIDFLVAAQLWSTLLYSINCGFLKSHDNLGNVETKSSKIIALAGENFDLKTFKIILG